MKINKVLKKMKQDGKLEGMVLSDSSTPYPTSEQQPQNTGFHSKGNSQKGAERQRSMGNRMQKPSLSK